MEGRNPINVLVKVPVLILGQFFEPGQIIEIEPEIWEQIDLIVKLVAFDEVEENG